MTRIIVWGRRNSVNVQKVMWAIGEMDLKYIRHDVSGSFGVNDNYLKLNPSGTVPTIEDGELALWESNTCIRYLAGQYGSGNLYPDNPMEVALADQWMEYQTSSLTPVIFQVFYNKIRLPAEQAKPDQITEGVRGCSKFFNKLNQHLAKQDFLAGDTFSMGDICIGSFMYRYYEMDIERPSIKFIEAWYQRLTERPAYRKHVMIPFGKNDEEWLEMEKRNAGIQ